MKIALVVPSIREEQTLFFLEAWQEQLKCEEVMTYLVEDNAEKGFPIEEDNYYQLQHLAWNDVPRPVLDCITVKSPACRLLGFWKAYQDNCDIIITLDDDVRPLHDESNYFRQYVDILRKGLPRWVDPLVNYRSRGYPEFNVGSMDVHGHVAAFLTIPDVDGDTQMHYEKEFDSNPPKYFSRPTIVPEGQYLPTNGGAFGFRRELTPFVHYTVWSEELEYYRFDDIWMGVILKKWMDLCGLRLSYGPPHVNHIRASNAVQNQKLERAGKVWNEEFWQNLDQAVETHTCQKPMGYQESFELIASCLKNMNNLWAEQEGKKMVAWMELFDLD